MGGEVLGFLAAKAEAPRLVEQQRAHAQGPHVQELLRGAPGEGRAPPRARLSDGLRVGPRGGPEGPGSKSLAVAAWTRRRRENDARATQTALWTLKTSVVPETRCDRKLDVRASATQAITLCVGLA